MKKTWSDSDTGEDRLGVTVYYGQRAGRGAPNCCWDIWKLRGELF